MVGIHDLNKYFESSNLANVGMADIVKEVQSQYQRRLRQMRRSSVRVIQKEGEIFEPMRISYISQVTHRKDILEFIINDALVNGKITVELLKDEFGSYYQAIIQFNVVTPLLAVVHFESNEFLVPKGFAGQVHFNGLKIKANISGERLIVTAGHGFPIIKVGSMRLGHGNFSEAGDMCLGTIQRVYNIRMIPALIHNVMRAVAMPTTHTFYSSPCPPSTLALLAPCARPFFTLQRSPPKSFYLPQFVRGMNIERELEQCIRNYIRERCGRVDDDYYDYDGGDEYDYNDYDEYEYDDDDAWPW